MKRRREIPIDTDRFSSIDKYVDKVLARIDEPERAEAEKQPTIRKRANDSEQSEDTERAANDEQPIVSERADHVESSEVQVRAKKAQQPMRQKRAISSAQPSTGKRAKPIEKPKTNERAAKSEQPTRNERAEYAEPPTGLSALREEIRPLVDAYYLIQEHRIASASQTRALNKRGKPAQFISIFLEEFVVLENQADKIVTEYANASTVGRWAQSICGIGPIIAGALIAHIDIEKANHPSAVWRFAGLDPTSKWEKGTRRPFNADLKKLCWKIGESFVKVSARDADIYGKIYLQRKAYEIERNDRGANAEVAKERMTQVRKSTEAYKYYKAGVLPPGHIHARAKRYAVKLFLAHWWAVAYEAHYGRPAPNPWIIEHGGHQDLIAPPNWPMQEKKTKGAAA